MATGSDRPERRASTRVRAHGRMVIHGARRDVGTVDDVSASGVRFHTHAPDSCYSLAERVAIDLRFDGVRGGWFALTGAIQRVDSDGTFVVILDASSADLAEGVSRAIGALQPDAVVHVLLFDPVTERRQRIAAAMRACGRHVREAASPLEVIAELDSGASPRLIAISDTWPPAIADSLWRYLVAEYGELRLLRLAGGGDEADEVEEANARMDDDGGPSAQRTRPAPR